MKSFFRILIGLSLIFNLLVVFGALFVIDKKGGLPWLSRQVAGILQPPRPETNRLDFPNSRLSVFEQLPVGPGDIVFLGDSIFAMGEWHEYLDDGRAKNRAIDGEDTRGILKRLKPIVSGKPRHVVIHCGINNFQNHIPYSQTTSEYTQIVDTISSRSAQTDIWMLPVLPVNERLYKKWILRALPGMNKPERTAVEDLNAFIKRLAAGSSRVHFVDVPALLNPEGELREECTYDGLHLNGRGLKKVAKRLQGLGLTGGTDPDKD